MSRKRVALALGLWFVVLVVACGERLLTPEPAASVARNRENARVIHAFQAKMIPERLFLCETAEYTGSQSGRSYQRGRIVLDGPDKPEPVSGSNPDSTLVQYLYIRWDRESGLPLFEANCTLPRRPESHVFATTRLHEVGPGRRTSGTGQDAADSDASSAAGGGWGDEVIYCSSQGGDVLLCDQTYCIEEYNAADLGRAPAGDTPQGGGGGGEREWDCENDCTIYWTSEDGYWYFCAWLGEEECDPWEDDCCCDEYGYDCEWSQFWGGECPDPGGGGGGGGGQPQEYTVQAICPPSVVRGNELECTVTGTAADTSMFTWTFVPTTVRLFDYDPLSIMGDPVPGPSGVGQTAWGGTMVYPGWIKVEARPNPSGGGTANPVRDSQFVAIQDRTDGIWATTPESISQKPTLTDPWGDIPGVDNTVALNFAAGSPLVPDVNFAGDYYYPVIEDGGPNTGYGYVTETTLQILREWQLNQYLDPTGPTVGMDSINWWGATNAITSGNSSKYIAGLQRHETNGGAGDFAGPGVGHQGSLAQGLNGDECGNIRLRLERTAGSYTSMPTMIEFVIAIARQYVNRAIDAGHSWVGNNVGVLIATYNQTTSNWETTYSNDYQPPGAGSNKTAPLFCNVEY